MNTYQYQPIDLQYLRFYIQNYINQLHDRVEFHTANGESSSSFPPIPTAVASANPTVVADAAMVKVPIGFFNHIQYYNMNINQNHDESVQHHIPVAVASEDPLVVLDVTPMVAMDLASVLFILDFYIIFNIII